MNVSAHHKLFAMVMSLGLIAGCSSTGETTEDGAYGSDVSAVDQEGGSTVYGGDDDGAVSSSEMSEEQRREAEARAARAEGAAVAGLLRRSRGVRTARGAAHAGRARAHSWGVRDVRLRWQRGRYRYQCEDPGDRAKLAAVAGGGLRHLRRDHPRPAGRAAAGDHVQERGGAWYNWN